MPIHAANPTSTTNRSQLMVPELRHHRFPFAGLSRFRPFDPIWVRAVKNTRPVETPPGRRRWDKYIIRLPPKSQNF